MATKIEWWRRRAAVLVTMSWPRAIPLFESPGFGLYYPVVLKFEASQLTAMRVFVE